MKKDYSPTYIIRAFVALLLFFTSLQLHAKELVSSEYYMVLKKYGLAYCLSHHRRDDTDPSDLTKGMAKLSNLYSFDQKAFENIGIYIDGNIEQHIRYAKHDGQPMYFTACMSLYESSEYQKILTQQDIYLKE